MPEHSEPQLRIYCICGQKMRVSDKMYGLPGKCISCRQKIRIPRRDEVPEGCTELHLKDHPELLRQSGIRRRKVAPASVAAEAEQALEAAPAGPSDSDEEPTPITELDVVEEEPERPPEGKAPKPSGEVASIPLDPYEPLQKILSIRYKAERQLHTLREYREKDEALEHAVNEHLKEAETARERVAEQLRQLLLETAIELSSTNEKIAERRLAARMGEITYDEYHETMDRLRSRRDRLERRQQNLRGWSAADNPFIVGGFRDLPLDGLSDDGREISIPSESEELVSRFEFQLSALREALENRAQAERRLGALEREKEKGDPSEAVLRRNARGELRRAQATVAFIHDRLAHLRNDLEADLETIKAQAETIRGRLKTNAISGPQYGDAMRRLEQAKEDTQRARSIVSRSLSANSPGDVPSPQGTFLERLAFSRRGKATGAESWFAWLAAGLLIVATFLPALGGGDSLATAFAEFRGTSPGAWSIFLPLSIAVLTALAAAVGDREIRGRVFAGLWFVATVLAAYVIHQAWFALDPMAARFRSGDFWLLRPGMFLFGLGNAGLLIAAGIVLLPARKSRPWFAIPVATGLIAAAAILTNLFGVFRAEPRIDVSVGGSFSEGTRQTTITISNEGRSTLRLLNQRTDARAASLYLLERQIGENSWLEVPGYDARLRAERDGGAYTLEGGQQVQFSIALQEGTYRAQLISGADNVVVSQRFEVQGAEPVPEEPAEPIAETPPPGEPLTDQGDQMETPEPNREPSSLPVGPIPEVELQGIVEPSGNGSLTFTFQLHFPDGSSQRITRNLGDELWQGWTVTEYNPARRTVAFSKDESMLILGRNQRVPLSKP